jgi:hypothetical protein
MPPDEKMQSSVKSRHLLEDEWNDKQDRVNYFWKVIAAIAIAALVVTAFL